MSVMPYLELVMNLVSRRSLFFYLALVLLSAESNVFAAKEGFFLDPEQAFTPTVTVVDDELLVDWHIEQGYFLYRHGFETDAEFENGDAH